MTHPAPPAELPPIDRLLAIMARLRDRKDGCPWDVEQTFATIAPYTVEEAYEVADAIRRDSMGDLAVDLQTAVARETAKTGAYDGARIVLELADVRPNRPTFKQMADNPSLSYSSFSTGGADIQGHAVMPNGQVIPLSYSYYETDIRFSRLGGTWADADGVIDRFAHRLARGDLVASR